MASGRINYQLKSTAPESYIMVYKDVSFSSSDLGFLNWIYKELTSLGCDDLQLRKRGRVTTSKQQAESQSMVYTLVIRNTPANRDVLSSGLAYLEEMQIPLDGKLQMLRDFLKAPENTLPGTAAAPRDVSFHAYISRVREDPVACVVAQ